jgi:hypothetical protein
MTKLQNLKQENRCSHNLSGYSGQWPGSWGKMSPKTLTMNLSSWRSESQGNEVENSVREKRRKNVDAEKDKT